MPQTALFSTILYPLYWQFPGNQDSEGLKKQDKTFTVTNLQIRSMRYSNCSSYLHFDREKIDFFWSACKDHFNLKPPTVFLTVWMLLYFWTPGEIKGHHIFDFLIFDMWLSSTYVWSRVIWFFVSDNPLLSRIDFVSFQEFTHNFRLLDC